MWHYLPQTIIVDGHNGVPDNNQSYSMRVAQFCAIFQLQCIHFLHEVFYHVRAINVGFNVQVFPQEILLRRTPNCTNWQNVRIIVHYRSPLTVTALSMESSKETDSKQHFVLWFPTSQKLILLLSAKLFKYNWP